ncbi:pentapeptide repeat-containing protein [Micromonospora aurantiaca]|uniref:pentapeptide repeat-containing protein n=1 Tax=Micromonospora aurantiaca (nom. illeg.) TaxID=47850 RepID=UPI0033DF287B
MGALLVSTVSIYYTGRSVEATRSQVRLQEQGQITDRFARAVEHLGAEQSNVRLGAIYSLERIMRDSPADQPTIIEVLCGFVRERSPNKATSYNPYDFSWKSFTEGPWVRRFTATDIQAALTVLGRRNIAHDDDTRIDLSGANLDGALLGGQFQSADLKRSSLVKAHLQGWFANADFTEADLAAAEARGSRMPEATFRHARLDQANFSHTHLQDVDMNTASGIGTNFGYADLTGADLQDVKMSAALFFQAKLVKVWLVDADLSRSDLGPGADLQDAKLRRANLRGADLTDALHIPQPLACVQVDKRTRFDPGTSVDPTVCKEPEVIEIPRPGQSGTG